MLLYLPFLQRQGVCGKVTQLEQSLRVHKKMLDQPRFLKPKHFSK